MHAAETALPPRGGSAAIRERLAIRGRVERPMAARATQPAFISPLARDAATVPQVPDVIAIAREQVEFWRRQCLSHDDVCRALGLPPRRHMSGDDFLGLIIRAYLTLDARG